MRAAYECCLEGVQWLCQLRPNVKLKDAKRYTAREYAEAGRKKKAKDGLARKQYEDMVLAIMRLTIWIPSRVE